MIKIDNIVKTMIENSEKELSSIYAEIEEIAEYNQLKVLNAFTDNNIEPRHFNGSTGYGYDDAGRDTLNKVCASIFGAESAIMSPTLSSGTQALSQALLGILRPSDNVLCISGMPYDTLHKVIFGEKTGDIGSLKDYGITFDIIDMYNNEFDKDKILNYLGNKKTKMIYIQRSKGYEYREAICISKMKDIIQSIRSVAKNIIIMVDNCYGELTEKYEPTEIGADLVVGSLIKNLGAGIAPNGGYIVGKKQLVDLVSYRITSPALGVEVGSYESGYRAFYQGLFLAPHVVANAKKGTRLTAMVLNSLGYDTLPNINSTLSDIVCCIKFNDEKKLIQFCRSIQNASPVDGNAHLEPWDMPGYENKIIMAAGAFQQGSSIELSCDAPIRPPYTAYMQGGLTYEHIKIALNYAVHNLMTLSE